MNNNVKKESRVKICQEYMLILLKFLHNLCEEHNIRYTLEAGTLLGAIRNKGFIPWDDDADVTLVREEYEKLIHLLKVKKLPDYIGVYYPKEEKEFFDYNVRLYYKNVIVRDDEASRNLYNGFYMHPILDIFVMDHVPKSPFKRRIYVLKQQILFGLAMSRRNSITLTKYKKIERIAIWILSKVGKLFSLKTIIDMQDKAAKQFLGKNVDYLYCTGWPPEFPGWLYKKELYESTHLTEFEDTKLYVLDAYEEVLTYGYGKWRTPIKTHDHDNFIENL